MGDLIAYIIIFLAGIFSILGGVFNWNWFMNNRRARFFVKVFGRGGARIFYIILGVVLLVLGVAAMFR